MIDYVFPPPALPSVAVRGRAERFPVTRIFCVGRNYAAHAREMGADPDREPPFYFIKSSHHLVSSGGTVPYPPDTQNFHHEVELVIALGRPAFRVPVEQALACVWGYACGLDMTRRDLQARAREAGKPWDLAKDFENAAVIGELVPASEIGHPAQGRITLAVNGVARQQGDLSDMIWRVPEIIANLSQSYHLQPGDLIYTGTPEGVGAVQPGDRLSAEIEGVGSLSLNIDQPE